MKFHWMKSMMMLIGGVTLVTGMGGCASSKPDVASGKARIEIKHTIDLDIDKVSAATPRYREGQFRIALVTKIIDEAGKEVYNYKDRGSFQVSIDLSPGKYKVHHTCSSDAYKYEQYHKNWNRYEWAVTINLKAGDLVELRANRNKPKKLRHQNRRVFDCIGYFNRR